MASKTTLESLLDLTAKFVIDQKGAWDHGDWEAFLAKAAALGFEDNDEMRRNLGNILESCKYFYAVACPGGVCSIAPKKAAAKPKARAKAR